VCLFKYNNSILVYVGSNSSFVSFAEQFCMKFRRYKEAYFLCQSSDLIKFKVPMIKHIKNLNLIKRALISPMLKGVLFVSGGVKKCIYWGASTYIFQRTQEEFFRRVRGTELDFKSVDLCSTLDNPFIGYK